MPYVCRPGRVSPSPAKQSGLEKSRKRWSRGLRNCLPHIYTGERHSLTKLWTRYTWPRRRPRRRSRVPFNKKATTKNLRPRVLFRKAKNTCKHEEEGEENRSPVSAVTGSNAQLKSLPLPSAQLPVSVESYSQQNTPDEKQAEVECSKDDSQHRCYKTESFEGHIEFEASHSPLGRQDNLRVCWPTPENCCTLDNIDTEQQSSDPQSCTSSENVKERNSEAHGSKEPGRLREIVVVFSWDSKKKRRLRRKTRRVRSPICRNIFFSPSRASGSCDSTSPSSGYSASGSSVGRSERLSSGSSCRSLARREQKRSSSGSSSGAYWQEGRRRSWSSASETHHADESEVCSCSSVVSSEPFSPLNLVFFSPCTQNTETVGPYRSTGYQKKVDQRHGESHQKWAGTQAVRLAKTETEDISASLAQGFPLPFHQGQNGGPNTRARQDVQSPCRQCKPHCDPGVVRRFKQSACKKAASARKLPNTSSKTVDGPAVSSRDACLGAFHASVRPSVLSASTTSSYWNTPQTIVSPCVGTLQDTASIKTVRTTSSLRTNITSQFPLSSTESFTGFHPRHLHAAPHCGQTSRFSVISKASRTALQSTTLYRTASGRATADRHSKRGRTLPQSSEVGAVGRQILFMDKAPFLLPCTAYLAKVCKSKLQALPLLSTIVKISHAVATAAHKRGCAAIERPELRKMTIHTQVAAGSEILPPIQEVARQKPVRRKSRIHVGHQLFAVESSSTSYSSGVPSIRKKTDEVTTMNGIHKTSKVADVCVSVTGACLTIHSSSPSLTGDIADSDGTLVSLSSGGREREEGKRRKSGENPENSVRSRVVEPRSQQRGRHRQRVLARSTNIQFLVAPDASRTSQGVLKVSNVSSYTAAGAVVESATNQYAAARVKKQSLADKAKNASSLAAFKSKFFSATVASDTQKETQLAEAARPIATRASDSASMFFSLSNVGSSNPSSSTSGLAAPSTVTTQAQRQERWQSISVTQRTERDCAKGEIRRSSANGTCRSEADSTKQQDARRKFLFCYPKADTGLAEASTRAFYVVGVCTGSKENGTDDRYSKGAEEAIRNVQKEGMEKRCSSGHCMHVKCRGGQLHTVEGGNLLPTPRPDQRTVPTPVKSPTASAAAASRASRIGLDFLAENVAREALLEEHLSEETDFLCACLRSPRCAAGPTVEQSGGKVANLPCTSLPVRHLFYDRRSHALHKDRPENAAAPSAGADLACPVVSMAEDVSDVASSRDLSEGNEQLQAHQKAHTLCPVSSAAFSLQKAASEPFPFTETLSQAESVLSAVGLGFTSFIELGATALRNLLGARFEEETFVSHTSRNADNHAGGGADSFLCSEASCKYVPPSPSLSFTPEPKDTSEPRERALQEIRQLVEDGDKTMVTEVLLCAAPRSGTSTPPLLSSEGATGTTAAARSADTSVTSAAAHDHADASELLSIAGDIKASSPNLTRFRCASCCSAVTPAPAAVGSSYLPVSCCSTTTVHCSKKSASTLSCVFGKSNALNKTVDLHAVTPCAERADQGRRSGSRICSFKDLLKAAVSQRGMSATKGSTDMQHTAPGGTAAAPITRTPSDLSTVGCPATSQTAHSTTPSASFQFPGSTEGREVAGKLNSEINFSSGGDGSSQRGERRFCRRRGSPVDISGNVFENSVSSSNGGPPGTCAPSRSLSEVVHTRSRFSTVVLLQCLRPFTTKWDGPEKGFDNRGSVRRFDASSDTCRLPGAHQSCLIDQTPVQDRDTAISAGDSGRKSEKKSEVANVMRHAQLAAEQIQGAQVCQDTAGVTSTRSLSASKEALASRLALHPVARGGHADKTPAMTGKSAPTVAPAGGTNVAPAGTYGCGQPVMPSCLVSSSLPPMSFTTSRQRLPQCTSRRKSISSRRRSRIGALGGLALSPRFPPVLSEGLSTSWPQRGAQTVQQQHVLPPSPQEGQGEKREKRSQQGRPREYILSRMASVPDDGHSRRRVQRDRPQDVRRHNPLSISKQQLKMSHTGRTKVKEAQPGEEHAKQKNEEK